MVTAIIVAIAMLFGNAFFVGAEFAVVSVRRSNIELKALEGSKLAGLTLHAMEQVSQMLAGAQLGVTLCSLIFGAVAEPVVAHVIETPLHGLGVGEAWLHPVSFGIALTLMTYFHVVIGEMVPKNLALAGATRAALILVPPLVIIVRIAKPLVAALNAMANASVRLLGIKPSQEVQSSFSRDEVAGFVKESHREGLLSTEEENLLSGTLDFEERMIRHVILPLDRVTMTSKKPTWQEIEKLTEQTGFSRFPVPGPYNTLKGYVHVKDILMESNNNETAVIPEDCIRPLGRIKMHLSLREALAQMRRSRVHIAEVYSDKGNLMGIVMLEDVLEELVGPIRDETQK